MSTHTSPSLKLGASWYPEMWPASEWAVDVDRMRDVGFNLVRLFEFAWKRFEAVQGQFDFEWALQVLDLLHAADIRVILGTPTAAPPAWLTTKDPDVLQTHADGTRAKHGRRKHYNHHSRTYRGHARRIVQAMADHLGGHPAVCGWQIDNEMSGFDYGEETRTRFHEWLREHYGNIESLNRIWGLNFWSQAYDHFEQIPLVTAEVGSIQQPERHHPSLILAIARFQNEAWTSFMQEQIDILRAHSRHPVTTNMTGFISQMDWWAHFRPMDQAGVSVYVDQAHWDLSFPVFDRLRAEKPGPYALLETAPNWSATGSHWNIHHDERGIRAFAWISVLLGGDTVLFWQWRSHWAGQEMQHGTCVNQNGSWMPGKTAWQTLSREFSQLGDLLRDHPAQKGPVGILADAPNRWLFAIDPIDPSNRYEERIREDVHLPLLRAGYHRDLLHPEADLSPYRLLVVNRLAMLSDPAKERLAEWVTAGGTLLLGPLCGIRTEEMTLWRGSEYGGLEDLMGAEQAMRFSPHWVEDTIHVQFPDGTKGHPRIWCEAFTPRKGTEVLAHYRGGYGDGLPAVVSRSLGEGKVVSVGTTLDTDCWMTLFRSLAQEQDIHPLCSAGEGLLCCPRVDASGTLKLLGVINCKKEAGSFLIERNATDLFTGEHLHTGEVTLDGLQVRLLEIEET